MLPPVDAVLGAELIRDGGSLAAMFRGGGAEYVLFFPHLSDGARVVGYGAPSIRELLDFFDEPHVTRVRFIVPSLSRHLFGRERMRGAAACRLVTFAVPPRLRASPRGATNLGPRQR